LTYAECIMPAFFLLAAFSARFWLERRERRGPLLWSLFGLALVTGGIFVSQSRGVWVGVLLGSALFAALQGRRFFKIYLGAGVVAAVLFFALAPPNVKGRLLSVISVKAGTQGDQWSKQTRFNLWMEAFRQLKERPLTGVGADNVKLEVTHAYEASPRIWTETHNIFIQVLLETGFIGFGLFVWILVCCLRLLWRLRSSWVGPGLLGAFVAFLAAGLTESWLGDKEVAMLFWLLMGCADVLRRREKI
jgi:putative inorganic carbon (HCO3(-)) transporter